jgi:hypothetical protein
VGEEGRERNKGRKEMWDPGREEENTGREEEDPRTYLVLMEDGVGCGIRGRAFWADPRKSVFTNFSGSNFYYVLGGIWAGNSFGITTTISAITVSPS